LALFPVKSRYGLGKKQEMELRKELGHRFNEDRHAA